MCLKSFCTSGAWRPAQDAIRCSILCTGLLYPRYRLECPGQRSTSGLMRSQLAFGERRSSLVIEGTISIQETLETFSEPIQIIKKSFTGGAS